MPNKKPQKPKKSTSQTTEHSMDILVLPSVNGVNTVSAVKKIPIGNVGDIFKKIKETNEKIAPGDTQHLEDMLLNQAHTLEAIFYSCTHHMLSGEYLNQVRVYSDIALKAQKQCRNTIMAIADLKNPRQTTFVKNQNNAVNQQINLENKLSTTNELLEHRHDSMDIRTPITPISDNPQLETVDKIDGR